MPTSILVASGRIYRFSDEIHTLSAAKTAKEANEIFDKCGSDVLLSDRLEVRDIVVRYSKGEYKV